jgi:hypothetical protein
MQKLRMLVCLGKVMSFSVGPNGLVHIHLTIKVKLANFLRNPLF